MGKSNVKVLCLIFIMAMFAGCAFYSADAPNVRVYDQTKYYYDAALDTQNVRFSKSLYNGLLDTNPDYVTLQVSSRYPDTLMLGYLLTSTERHFIDTCYMDGKKLQLSKGRSNVKMKNDEVVIEEQFTVAIPLEDAIAGTCDENGLTFAFIGDYRVDLRLRKTTLQGVLKKAKDMKITEIEENCFDFVEEEF